MHPFINIFPCHKSAFLIRVFPSDSLLNCSSSPLSSPLPGVWVGLQESELRVLESEGQLSVCCELNGATGKNITVSLVSVEGSAQGELGRG